MFIRNAISRDELPFLNVAFINIDQWTSYRRKLTVDMADLPSVTYCMTEILISDIYD